jgi:hypothetical protein
MDHSSWEATKANGHGVKTPLQSSLPPSIIKLMNRHILCDLPKLSSSDVHLTRSFFHIDFLSPSAKAQAKVIVLKTTPVTRWKE